MKVVCSDEDHFFIQDQRGQHIRMSSEENTGDFHIYQFVKYFGDALL